MGDELFATDRASIEASYREHPQNLHNLLERLKSQGKNLEDLNEQDLACDSSGAYITDQNHVGGLDTVREIGVRLALKPQDRVLEVGAGLGGVCRGLSFLFGCRTVGVELTENRYQEAVELTRMVGLEDLVELVQGDIMEVPLEAPFDHLVSLATLVHFADQHAIFGKCRSLLKEGGMFVAEDSCLSDVEPNEEQSQILDRVNSLWNSKLTPLETTLESLRQCGLEPLEVIDRSDLLTHDLKAKLKSLEVLPEGTVSAGEQEVWEGAHALCEAGIIRSCRIVARAV